MTNIRHVLILCPLMIGFAAPCHATGPSPISKLSGRATRAISSLSPAATTHLWLFIDSSAIHPESIHLTTKALARRNKVDRVAHLVSWDDYIVPEDLVAAIRQTGAVVKQVSRWLKAVSVEATRNQVQSLAQLAFIRHVDLVSTFSRPADPASLPEPTVKNLGYGSSELQNHFVQADRLHSAGFSGRGVLITLIDSGFANKHRAFDSTHIVATYDFINHQIAVDDPGCSAGLEQHVHGTLILGAIGGYVPDTLIGVAYGAEFALAKTEITCGDLEIKIEEDNWIAAAEWADSLGADVISSSLGYTVFQDSGSYTQSQLDGRTARITKAAEIAASKNVLVVVSAGNSRGTLWGTIGFPADGDSVIAVGAVGSNGLLASFSSPGPSADGRVKPDITSLGISVFSANAYGGFRTASGTSLSTPLVAGGAALAIESDTTLTVGDLLRLIRQSGDRADHPDNDYGYGLFDAVKTADILTIIPPDSAAVQVGRSVGVLITTRGRSSHSAIISGLNLPEGSVVIDRHDGTAVLQITGVVTSIGRTQIGVVAAAGRFADTTYVVANTYASEFRVGPNPFTDSVRIFIEPVSGLFRSATIFNIAGEKVWEKVNNTGQPSDTIIKWDGSNGAGKRVSSGVYIVHIVTDRGEALLKLLKTD